ncbi:uncharacterized protein FIBRA_08231 [Fibroporia radiculosa]|uniref:Uncharacterized protein n=1 Tax=Fibroporia radiculosa TaxID=599839 RepID=J4GWF4_9APHY|nr:uncharacterized protein FIBRA_08231 [Fibroporia radiculosa]CCM05990.1 predicted protein [Fibroporia radiculosa]
MLFLGCPPQKNLDTPSSRLLTYCSDSALQPFPTPHNAFGACTSLTNTRTARRHSTPRSYPLHPIPVHLKSQPSLYPVGFCVPLSAPSPPLRTSDAPARRTSRAPSRRTPSSRAAGGEHCLSIFATLAFSDVLDEAFPRADWYTHAEYERKPAALRAHTAPPPRVRMPAPVLRELVAMPTPHANEIDTRAYSRPLGRESARSTGRMPSVATVIALLVLGLSSFSGMHVGAGVAALEVRSMEPLDSGRDGGWADVSGFQASVVLFPRQQGVTAGMGGSGRETATGDGAAPYAAVDTSILAGATGTRGQSASMSAPTVASLDSASTPAVASPSLQTQTQVQTQVQTPTQATTTAPTTTPTQSQMDPTVPASAKPSQNSRGQGGTNVTPDPPVNSPAPTNSNVSSSSPTAASPTSSAPDIQRSSSGLSPASTSSASPSPAPTTSAVQPTRQTQSSGTTVSTGAARSSDPPSPAPSPSPARSSASSSAASSATQTATASAQSSDSPSHSTPTRASSRGSDLTTSTSDLSSGNPSQKTRSSTGMSSRSGDPAASETSNTSTGNRSGSAGDTTTSMST